MIANISVSMISHVSPEVSSNRDAYRNYFISSGSSLISLLSSEDENSFMENTRLLKVSYDELIVPVSDIEIECVDYIARNNMYRITRDNIIVVISVLLRGRSVSAEEIKSTPFSLIEIHGLTTVQDFINRQIDIFVRDVFIPSDEKADSIITILNHEQLSDEIKADVVRSMTFTLDDLSLISEGPDTLEQGNTVSYHDLFYCYDRVSPSWTSLNAYLSEDSDLNTLTAYMTRHVDVLFQQGPGLLEGAEYDKLYAKIICNDALDDGVYFRLMTHIQVITACIDSRLSEKAFARLVMLNKLPLEAETFIEISDLYIQRIAALRNTFLTWLTHDKVVFLGNTDLFLRKDDNETFFCLMSSDILNNVHFTEHERAGLVLKYQDIWLSDGAPIMSIPVNIMLSVIDMADSEFLKIKMIVFLISEGYKEKTDISRLVNKLSEPELTRIFNNKREVAVELANRENYIPLLESLKECGIINKYELRDDGKFHISIKIRQYNED